MKAIRSNWPRVGAAINETLQSKLEKNSCVISRGRRNSTNSREKEEEEEKKGDEDIPHLRP